MKINSYFVIKINMYKCTVSDHVLHVHVHLVGHVPQEREDDESAKYTGQAVSKGHHERVPEITRSHDTG